MPSQVTSSRILLLGVENADGSVTGTTGAGGTGNQSTSQPILREVDNIISIYLRSIGTTSGGIVLIEEADWGPLEQTYSGTWSQVQSIAASTFTGGAQLAVHITAASYGWVRVRISSAITGGGTITAVARACGAA